MNDSSAEDPQLSHLLRAAKPVAKLPLGFQAAVWQRIEQQEAGVFSSWIGRAMEILLRPRWAAGAIAIVMFAGGWLGLRQSSITERIAAEMRYVVSVDPFRHQP